MRIANLLKIASVFACLQYNMCSAMIGSDYRGITCDKISDAGRLGIFKMCPFACYFDPNLAAEHVLHCSSAAELKLDDVLSIVLTEDRIGNYYRPLPTTKVAFDDFLNCYLSCSTENDFSEQSFFNGACLETKVKIQWNCIHYLPNNEHIDSVDKFVNFASNCSLDDFKHTICFYFTSDLKLDIEMIEHVAKQENISVGNMGIPLLKEKCNEWRDML